MNVPSLGQNFIDLRGELPGDSYKWNWERPLDQVNYLAIHHTQGSDDQTPYDLANFHINVNRWGGIGYHFLVDKEGLVFYVGDIGTARANVLNLNEQVIGIGLIGNFTFGRVPTPAQLEGTHKLCEFFINSNLLPNITSWDKVRGHKELPNQNSDCPGENFANWRIQIVEGVPVHNEVESLQASLAAVNQQNISLQEALQEKYEERDNTLTIVGALLKLFKSYDHK